MKCMGDGDEKYGMDGSCVRVNECGEVKSERKWCVCGGGESDGGDNVRWKYAQISEAFIQTCTLH